MSMGVVEQRSFFPHLPVGERSSDHLARSRGVLNFWFTRQSGFHSDMEALQANNLDPLLTWAEHREYIAALSVLMGTAVNGLVDFSNTSEARVIRNMLIELKPRLGSTASRPAFGKKPRLLRLYYAEPATYPRMLLGLHLSTKEDSASGLDEQDVAIDEAIDRACTWPGPQN